jgi:integrase
VAALVKAPQGRSGRPSKSFTLDQAKALLAASEHTRLHAYVVLSLLVGIRAEEARALHWDHVVTWVDDPAGWQPVASAGFDPSQGGEGRFAIYVWRSEREGGEHQDREIPEDPGAAAALRGGAAPAAGTAGARPADGR